MATIHSLAPEILSAIFEIAHDPWVPATMCSAALVCTAWRDPAQRELFLDIAVKVSYIDTEHKQLHKYLAQRLCAPRCVVLLCDAPHNSDPELYEPLEVGSDPLRWCAGALDVALLYFPLDPGFLGDVNLQDVENLYLKGTEWYPPPSSPLLPLLWPPHLRVVSLNSESISSELRDLRGLFTHYPSPGHLRRLSLSINYTDMDQTLGEGGLPPSVEECSLTLWMDVDCGGDFLLRHADFRPLLFEQLTMLTHLGLHLYDFIWEWDRNLLQSLYGILPPTIKRLTIVDVGHPEFSSCEHNSRRERAFPRIFDLITEANFPNLARLDFRRCKKADLDAYPAAADVLAECEHRSIRVVCREEFL